MSDRPMSMVHNRQFFLLVKKLAKLAISVVLFWGLAACGISPRTTAQERLFLDISLEYLDRYEIPKLTYQDTPVGGLSALTYDRFGDRFYVLSDDRSQKAPARFYTIDLRLDQSQSDQVKIDDVEFEAVTFLTDEEGNLYPRNSIDPEGIVLSPKRTLFISSEGILEQGIAPAIQEFALSTGRRLQSLRIPRRYLPAEAEEAAKGVQENLGFEALTLSPTGLASDDPFRLFTATESALYQDNTPNNPEVNPTRFLHYYINSVSQPILVAEHLYLLDPADSEVSANGLTELITLDREGYFLSLERTYGASGNGAKIFQAVIGNATDISGLDSLKGNPQAVPIKKTLLLDLNELGIELDNLEGMTLGAHLQDGSQTLVLLSDDNFKDNQVSQLLLFRLVKN